MGDDDDDLKRLIFILNGNWMVNSFSVEIAKISRHTQQSTRAKAMESACEWLFVCMIMAQ